MPKKLISVTSIASGCFYALFLFIPLLYCDVFFSPYMAKPHIGFLLAGLAVFFSLLNEAGSSEESLAAGEKLISLKYLPVVVFAIACFLSSVFSAFPMTALASVKEMIVYLFVFAVAVWFSVRIDMFRVALLLGISCLVVSGVSVYEYNVGQNITGLLGNKNVLVSFLILALPLVLAAMLRPVFIDKKMEGRRENWLFSIVCTLFFVAGLAAVVIARSRAGTVCFVLSMTVFLIALSFLRSRNLGRGVLCVLVLILVGLYFSGFWKIIPTLVVEDVRFYIWQGALNVFWAKPVLGHGPGTFFIVYPGFRPVEYFLNARAADITVYAHCAYLEILAECGALGLSAFVMVIAGAFRQIYLAFKNAVCVQMRIMFVAMACGLGGLLLHNAFDPNLSLSGGIAMLMWIFLGLFYGANNKIDKSAPETVSKLNPKPAILFACGFACVFYFWSLCPMCGDYFFRKAVQHKYYGRNHEAELCFDSAISFVPTKPEYYFRKGFFLASIGRIRESVMTYEQLSRLCPDYSDLHLNLGILYLGAGDAETAQLHLERQLKLNPYDIKARKILLDARRRLFASSASVRREHRMIDIYERILNQRT